MSRARHSPSQEGWTRHQDEVAKPPLTERTGAKREPDRAKHEWWSRMEPFLKNAFRNTSSIPTTPSAPLRRLRIFLSMAQPPLLYQEGSRQPYIHSHLHRPRLQSFFASLKYRRLTIKGRVGMIQRTE